MFLRQPIDRRRFLAGGAALAAASAFAGRRRAAAVATGAETGGLFLAEEMGWIRWLDPISLKDWQTALPIGLHGGMQPTDVADRRIAWFYPASDGSSLVRLDFPVLTGPEVPGDVRVSVFPGPLDDDGRSFSAPAYPMRAWFDGTDRLLTASFPPRAIDPGAAPTPVTWHVLDTTDGSLVSAAEFFTYLDGSWLEVSPDPALRTLYALVSPPEVGVGGPGALRLVATDLASGKERAALALPELRLKRLRFYSGNQTRDDVAGPSLAVSPVGSLVAVVDGEGRAVSLHDAAKLAVEATIPIEVPNPPAGTTEDEPDLTSWSWPPAREAIFSPDGKRLFLAGFGAAADPRDPNATVDYALRVLDLATGAVVRDAAGLVVTRLAVAPDGESVYVLGMRTDVRRSQVLNDIMSFRRLDTRDLVTLAERRDIDPYLFHILPSPDQA